MVVCATPRLVAPSLLTSPGAPRPPPLLPPPGACRAVITASFDEKGLVRQQLDSFNDFINSSLQEIVDESKLITVKPQSQHMPGQAVEEDVERTYEVRARGGGVRRRRPPQSGGRRVFGCLISWPAVR